MSPFSLAVAKIELLYAGTTLAENAPATLGGGGTGFFYDARGFVAVYSGRVGDDALGFQLGTARRAEVVEGIVEAKLPGRHPVEFPRREASF
jgi:hypothetical protein